MISMSHWLGSRSELIKRPGTAFDSGFLFSKGLKFKHKAKEIAS